MKKLHVVFNGWGTQWLLGTLADNGSALLFEYSPEALRQGIEFSPRFLKLQAAAYGGFPRHLNRLPGLVADALPDSWGMLLMDRLFRKQGRPPARLSPLDRLAFLGERAMGALSFMPADAPDLHGGDDPGLAELAAAAHTLAQGKDHELLRELLLAGAAAPGSRPKVLLQFDPASEQTTTREGVGGTPWLFKFPAKGEHKEVCAIEHVYAELARLCGLDMRDTRHFDLERRMATFAVERYDREDGMRVPVHSLAGLLHSDYRLPGLDYRVLLRATRLMTRDESQVRAAFERCVFNVVFHNRDDHARNFGYRMNRRGDWELAPCHDLTFSAGPGGDHHMAVMGESEAPGAAELLRLAADASLPHGWALEVLERMADHGSAFAVLARTAPIRAATVKTISRAIAANASRML